MIFDDHSARSSILLLSAAPFACLILDHLLCPEARGALDESVRRQLEHVKGLRSRCRRGATAAIVSGNDDKGAL